MERFFQKSTFWVIVALLCAPLASLSAQTHRVENGQSQAEVVAILGEPEGNITSGNSTYLTYAGLRVKLTNGTVTDLAADFNEKLAEARAKQAENEAFEAAQKAKGLIAFQGRWVTAEERDEIRKMHIMEQLKSAQQQDDRRAYMVKRPDGTIIDYSPLLVKGKVNIVDFYANWCGPCKKLAPQLKELAEKDKQVELRAVDIETFDSKVAKHFNITSVPNVRVFDVSGALVAPPSHDIEKIKAAVEQAKKQSRVHKIFVY